MKKWIPLAGLLLIAVACSKDDDREMLNQEPEGLVMDHTNDIPTQDEFRKNEDQ